MRGASATAILAATCWFGCSTTVAARQPISAAWRAEFNEQLAGETVTVMLRPEVDAGASRPLSPADDSSCRAGRSAGRSCSVNADCGCGLACEADADPTAAHTCVDPAATRAQAEAEERVAVGVELGHEKTTWLELVPSSGEWHSNSVPTAALQRITLRAPRRGLLEGIGLGFLAGAGTGGLIALSANPGRGCNDYRCSFAAIGAVLGALAGPIVGGLLGYEIGHRTKIQLEPAQP